MKGEIKEGVGAFPEIPITPLTPSFIRRGNSQLSLHCCEEAYG
jgi:hypothetical protein